MYVIIVLFKMVHAGKKSACVTFRQGCNLIKHRECNTPVNAVNNVSIVIQLLLILYNSTEKRKIYESV